MQVLTMFNLSCHDASHLNHLVMKSFPDRGLGQWLPNTKFSFPINLYKQCIR